MAESCDWGQEFPVSACGGRIIHYSGVVRHACVNYIKLSGKNTVIRVPKVAAYLKNGVTSPAACGQRGQPARRASRQARQAVVWSSVRV